VPFLLLGIQLEHLETLVNCFFVSGLHLAGKRDCGVRIVLEEFLMRLERGIEGYFRVVKQVEIEAAGTEHYEAQRRYYGAEQKKRPRGCVTVESSCGPMVKNDRRCKLLLLWKYKILRA